MFAFLFYTVVLSVPLCIARVFKFSESALSAFVFLYLGCFFMVFKVISFGYFEKFNDLRTLEFGILLFLFGLVLLLRHVLKWVKKNKKQS
ncbi:MAG: hypothetical protein ACYTFY_16705 [Planctomycetota bacterium]|jgi:hypothetical protein